MTACFSICLSPQKPGTGKSYQIREIAENELGIAFNEDTQILSNTVKTVFHPEYTYADFMGKLLPLTQGNSVIYKFYPGHFLNVLGMAYKSLIDDVNENYLLVIDELNRGNAAAIFGNVFQLLDRDDSDWSSYEVDVSEMELVNLLRAIGLEPTIDERKIVFKNGYESPPIEVFCQQKADELEHQNLCASRVYSLLSQGKIKIPHNLSIIATINTSDESIYYLDSAFKRRWDWEYVNVPAIDFGIADVPEKLKKVNLFVDGEKQHEWYFYIVGINELIKSNYQTIRRIEDKQIGWWFIKPKNDKVELQQVKDKLMFYLWDSVFARDKKPLEQFLSAKAEPVKLAVYSDFINLTEDFMEKVYELGSKNYQPF